MRRLFTSGPGVLQNGPGFSQTIRVAIEQDPIPEISGGHEVWVHETDFKKLEECLSRFHPSEVLRVESSRSLKEEIQNRDNLLERGVLAMKSVCDLKGCDFDDIHEWLRDVEEFLKTKNKKVSE